MILKKHKWGKPAPPCAVLSSKAFIQCFLLMGSRWGGNSASLCRKIALIKIQIADMWGHIVRLGICFRNCLILSLQLTSSQCCLHCSSDSCCSSLPHWWAQARKALWAIRGYFSMSYTFCHLPRTPGTSSQFFSSSQITDIWIISPILSLIPISRDREQVPAQQRFGGLGKSWQSKWPLRVAASGISNAYGSLVPGHFTAKLKSSFITWS